MRDAYAERLEGDRESAPAAFLCSPHRTELLGIRKKLFDYGRDIGRPVWVAEWSAPELRDLPEDEIIDVCLDRIRHAQSFLCILNGAYGVSAKWTAAKVSLIELEIFQAALWGKPLQVYLLEPFEPDGRLESLLTIVREVFPSNVTCYTTEESLLVDARRAIEDTSRSWMASLLWAPLRIARLLVETFARLRSPLNPKPQVLSDVRFLNDSYQAYSPEVSEDLLEDIWRTIDAAEDKLTRLTRVWMLIRRLCAAPPHDERHAGFLPWWEKALKAWSSSAAWAGLHGHTYLGRLAAANSLLEIRQRLACRGGQYTSQLAQSTYGAIASEYYSIGRQVASRADAAAYLEYALRALDTALDARPSDPSGLLAIQGNVLLQLRRFGDARRVFDEAVVIRRRSPDNPGALGESYVDLGYSYLAERKWRKAGNFLEEGVALMEAAGRWDFLVRAKKRLARYYLHTWQPRRALDELIEAAAIARRLRMEGQLDEILRFLAGRVPRRWERGSTLP